MNNKILIVVLLLLLIGCKNKEQNYNYELEDSDESYVMDSWSNDQKEDYYNKVGNLIKEFLSREKYNIPDQNDFDKNLADKLGIKLNSTKKYQIIPYHIFEKDSLDGYSPHIIVFPTHKIISFESELPLLNKSSLEHYNSSDFKNLDHSKEYNVVINKLLFSPNQKEIDTWLEDEQLNELFTYLVCSFHFRDKKIFQHVIKRLSNEKDTDENNSEYLQLIFKRDKKIIDKDFLSEIANQDGENKMYAHFKNVINSEMFNVNERKNFQKEIEEIYEQRKAFKNKNNINFNINASWNGTYSGSFLRLKEESADPRAWGQIKLNVNGKKATLNIDSYVENVQKEMEIISESTDQLKLKDVSEDYYLILSKKSGKIVMEGSLMKSIVGVSEQYELSK